MAEIIVERYEVCLGTSPADASPTILGDNIATRAGAEAVRDLFLGMVQSGAVSGGNWSGRTVYVRSMAGNQKLAASDTSAQTVIATAQATPCTVPLFVRTKEDDGTTTRTRIADVPGKLLGTLTDRLSKA